ncbi:hypothetical protein [Bacillus swezeyi]|uniref:hypothetical protein n=1 Tax=Bacillus swezeyi TaxID=1925020 RepID=UPI003F8BD005
MEGELTAYQKSWHYLFIVQIISKLIEIREKSNIELNKDLKEVKKILNEIYGSPRVSTLSTPNLSAMGFEGSFGEISFEEINANEQLKQALKSNAFRLLDYFEKILISNIAEEKIMVILDQLDESWLESEIEEYSKILINLITTCNKINNKYEYSNNIKVVPFLRTDIYETLMFKR